MATYAIGDIQGCVEQLQSLLKHIHYRPGQDALWFAGDLVNRGPSSLDVMRMVSTLPDVVVVLGNHDWHLLTLALAPNPPSETTQHTMADILDAPDRDYLIGWLCQQKMLHYDSTFNVVMSHAGIPPCWNVSDGLRLAAEVEGILKSDQLPDLLDHLYGDEPNTWAESLSGHDRHRYIINALCRMRYVNSSGGLVLEVKGKPQQQPAALRPWYEAKHALLSNTRVLFGHWAALEGHTSHANAIALDTGCVWGGRLSAFRLDDEQWFHVPGMTV